MLTDSQAAPKAHAEVEHSNVNGREVVHELGQIARGEQPPIFRHIGHLAKQAPAA